MWVEENITKKNVTTKTVWKETHAKKDTLRTARHILEEIAGLEKIVPFNIQETLLSKISVKLNRK